MNRLVSCAALAALTLVASLPALPASAAPVTLVVGDVDPLPGQAFSVNGDGDDCPADGGGSPGTFIATLTYTTAAGPTAEVLATGDVAADGTFASSLTVPANAVSNQPANVVAAATCSGVSTASNQVNLTIPYHSGTIALSANSVSRGDSFTVTGTGCYGGEFVLVYGTAGGDPNDFDDGINGIPATNRSFSGVVPIPATQAPGRYDVYALCPGTQYAAQQLTINAGTAAAPSTAATPAPAATAPATTTTVVVVPGDVVPDSTTTLGGGFSNERGAAAGVAGAAPGNTPIASAPVAVAAEATFTG